MTRYEWKESQLWDNDRGCWVIWDTVGGVIGATDELKTKIAHWLNEEANPTWGAGDEYVASLREQWGEIDKIVADEIGRTPGGTLPADVRQLARRHRKLVDVVSDLHAALRDILTQAIVYAGTPEFDAIVDRVRRAIENRSL